MLNYQRVTGIVHHWVDYGLPQKTLSVTTFASEIFWYILGHMALDICRWATSASVIPKSRLFNVVSCHGCRDPGVEGTAMVSRSDGSSLIPDAQLISCVLESSVTSWE